MHIKKIHQVINDVRSRSVSPRITEPFAARRYVTPNDTSGIRHPTITASMFSEIPFTKLIIIIITGILKIQPAHSGSKRIHHLAAASTPATRPTFRSASRSSRNRWGIWLVIRTGTASFRRVGEWIGGRRPCYRWPNRVTELWIIEIFALSVEFEESVSVVTCVRLRSRVK